MKLTAERVRELLHYDPETGALTNRITRAARAQAGQVAGSWNSDGYLDVRIEGVREFGHRLIWLYMTGELPQGEIDHDDGDRSNNRWLNLRDGTHQMNMQNVPARGSRTSGLPGAYRVRNRYKALIRVAGKCMHLGYFATAEEAHAAYKQAKLAYHPGCGAHAQRNLV
jgi:hypothetical protein